MDKIHLIRSADHDQVDPFDRFGPERVHAISGLYACPLELDQDLVDFEQNEQDEDFDSSNGRNDGAVFGVDDIVSNTNHTGGATSKGNAGPPSAYSRNGDDFVTVVSRGKRRPAHSHPTRSPVSTKLKVVKADEWNKIMDKKRGGKGRRNASGLGPTSIAGLSSSQMHARNLSDPEAEFDSSDYANMKQLNPRPCHMQYLVGKCDNKKCQYGHQYELTVGELAAIRTLAKEMVSTDRACGSQDTSANTSMSCQLCPLHAVGKCKLWNFLSFERVKTEQSSFLLNLGHKTSEACIYGHMCPRTT